MGFVSSAPATQLTSSALTAQSRAQLSGSSAVVGREGSMAELSSRGESWGRAKIWRIRYSTLDARHAQRRRAQRSAQLPRAQRATTASTVLDAPAGTKRMVHHQIAKPTHRAQIEPPLCNVSHLTRQRERSLSTARMYAYSSQALQRRGVLSACPSPQGRQPMLSLAPTPRRGVL